MLKSVLFKYLIIILQRKMGVTLYIYNIYKYSVHYDKISIKLLPNYNLGNKKERTHFMLSKY